eukprot:gene5988-biopygen3281
MGPCWRRLEPVVVCATLRGAWGARRSPYTCDYARALRPLRLHPLIMPALRRRKPTVRLTDLLSATLLQLCILFREQTLQPLLTLIFD